MRCCISVDSITTMSDTHSRHTIRSLPLLTTRYCPSCYRVSRKSVCLCAGLSPGSLCTVYREIFHWCRIRTERAGLGRGGRGRSERGQSGERSEERGLGAGHSTARPSQLRPLTLTSLLQNAFLYTIITYIWRHEE